MAHVFDGMFDLAMPWWAFVLRACIVYFILLALIRASGKRTMGQFTPFDMLLVVLLGNAVQNALLGQDTSVGGGLLLATTLLALNWLVGLVSARSARMLGTLSKLKSPPLRAVEAFTPLVRNRVSCTA